MHKTAEKVVTGIIFAGLTLVSVAVYAVVIAPLRGA